MLGTVDRWRVWNTSSLSSFLFPGPLGHALVTVLHAIVLIKSRNRTEGFVVKAGLAERFFEVFLEIVKRAQVGSEGRLPFAAGRLKKLLETTVNQHSDFAVHDDPGGFDHADVAVQQLKNHCAPVAADPNPV